MVDEVVQQQVRIWFQPRRESLTPVGSGSSTPGGGVAVRGRLLSARSMLRHRLVAIWYSQVRSEDRCRKSPRLRQADTSVSWSASSAS